MTPSRWLESLDYDSVLCACFAVRLQNKVEMSLTLKLNISQTKLDFGFPRNCNTDASGQLEDIFFTS